MRYQFPISVPYSYAYRLQLSVFETEKHKLTLELKCVNISNFATENRYLSPKLLIAGYYRKCNQFARFTKITVVDGVLPPLLLPLCFHLLAQCRSDKGSYLVPSGGTS